MEGCLNLRRHFLGCSMRLCYEASYVGFCLQRDLRFHGVHCDVVAPSSIPIYEEE